MWLAKFKVRHDNCLIAPLCMKYNVTDFIYLVNSWKEKNKFYYTELHILQGTEENKKKFVKALKREKTIIKIEQKGNHIFTLNKEPLEKEIYSPAFDPKIIQVKPIAQRTDGFEDWEYASWDKKILMDVIHIPVFKVQLKSIKRIKIDEVFIPHIYPKLSPKQKEAIELAVKEGYYGYPRKIDLGGLAKIAKVKRQTLQENLRRAEKKLIPFLTESLY